MELSPPAGKMPVFVEIYKKNVGFRMQLKGGCFMKKLMAILLALVLCLGMCTANAEEKVDPAYVGAWDIYSVTLFGFTLMKEDLDWTMNLFIYENGDCFMLKDELVAGTKLIKSGSTYMMQGDGAPYPLVLDENGHLCMEMTTEDMTMDVVMAKTEMVVSPSEKVRAFAGQWKMKYVDLWGMQFTEEELGEVRMTIYESGCGTLSLDGDLTGFRMAEKDGVVYMMDNEVAYALELTEEGLVTFEMESEGITMKFVMEPITAE